MTSTIKAVVDDITELKSNYQSALKRLDAILADIEAEDRAWLSSDDAWLYEGSEIVGRQDVEPLESKYPWLRPGYDPNLDEL